MRLPSRTTQRSLAFNMTPMIDVVFLLIIFFLVSSHLAKQEVQTELDLPLAVSGQRPSTAGNARVTLNVLPDGVVMLAGRAVGPVELTQRLAVERQSAGNDLEVRVRSDRQVPYRYIEPIMLACARSGIWNLAFTVVRRQE